MIVVDTNVVASLLLPTSEHTDSAMRLLNSDREWVAPAIWRSEFCNMLVTGVRNKWWNADQAIEALANADEIMDRGEYRVPSVEVLRTAIESNCTAYDCEFVVLARDLELRLVTLDKAVLRTFPEIAVSLKEYALGGGA